MLGRRQNPSMDTDTVKVDEDLVIPVAELQFRFTTGGGPGGQHVNKVATRVTLLFDVANSPSLDEPRRERLFDRLSTRLDRQGVLHIDVHESRSQWQNRRIAIERLQALLSEALEEQPERLPTRPHAGAEEKRLAEKRRKGAVKRERRTQWDE